MKKHKNKKSCTDEQHHQHIRKRLAKKNLKISVVDHLVYVAGPMIPVAVAPQAYAVWVNGNVENVVLPTWVIFSFTSLAMTIYAFVHKEKPLILTYVPLLLLNVAVVVRVVVKT